MAVYIPIVSEFNSKGIDKAMKEFKSLEGAGKKAQFAIKKAAVPAALALTALAGAAAKSLSAGEAVNSANARILQINTSMGLFGSETKQVTNRLIKLAEATARQIGVDNISIKATQAKLLTFGKLAKTAGKVGSAFDRATAAALDLAAAGFGTAESNAVQLGKALENPIKGLASLAKSGVTFTDVEKEKIKTLVESGKLLEAQEMVLKAIETQVKGTAKATADDSKKMKEAFAQLTQSIGMTLLPVLTAITPVLIKVSDWANSNKGVFLAIAGAIGAIATAVILANVGLKIYTAYTHLATAAQFLFNAAVTANPITLMVIAIAALVAGLVVAYKKFEGFRNIINSVFSVINGVVQSSLGVIKSYFSALLGFYKGIFNSIASLWNNTIGKLSFKVPSWVPGLGGKGFSVPSIPMLAEGGIVNTPGGMLAMIGEKGPEAVIPLDRMGQMGGGTTVNINVNGGDPNAVVQALRTYMRQNGSVPIKISNAF
jgi:hypothetical protein